jgi:hypothetical protein
MGSSDRTILGTVNPGGGMKFIEVEPIQAIDGWENCTRLFLDVDRIVHFAQYEFESSESSSILYEFPNGYTNLITVRTSSTEIEKLIQEAG